MKYLSDNIRVFAMLAFLFVAIALPVFAAPIQYVPLAPLPGQEGSTHVSLGGYLSNMYTLIIGIAGVLAVLMIVIAGIEYMTPTSSAKESGKNRALAAILGLLLALVSYLILQTINPDLVGGPRFDLSGGNTNTNGTQSVTGSW
ncbi:MAG: hypothetical protein HZC03_01510 [Candidatus Lloydbacteria bacterium]|nr:hypothetical protein [Candidatus Lloydbacteria bacterium]